MQFTCHTAKLNQLYLSSPFNFIIPW